MFEMEKFLLKKNGISFKGHEHPELFFLIPFFCFNGLPEKSVQKSVQRKPAQKRSTGTHTTKTNQNLILLVHPGGLEPPTNRLRVYCSTN